MARSTDPRCQLALDSFPRGSWLSMTLINAMHAPLDRAYSMRTGTFVQVGTRMGDYSREDDEGNEYRVYADNCGDTRPMLSRDYKAGSFYPPNTFFEGEIDLPGDETRHLTHDELSRLAPCVGIFPGSIRRVVLPAGGDRFYAGIMTTPIEHSVFRGSYGSEVADRARRRLPDAHVDDSGRCRITIGVEP